MFNLVKEILEAAIVALVVFFLIDTSVQSFKVEGVSMAPTLQPGQYLVVNKLAYFELDTHKLSTLIPFWDLPPNGNKNRLLAREGPVVGDLVVFRQDSDSGRKFVKRIIGGPGDQVSIIGGVTYVNGDILREAYLPSSDYDQYYEYDALGVEEFFVMGDNRGASSDSRHWGPIRMDNVIGKVLADYNLPFDVGFIKETE